jgi:hypothetical protein
VLLWVCTFALFSFTLVPPFFDSSKIPNKLNSNDQITIHPSIKLTAKKLENLPIGPQRLETYLKEDEPHERLLLGLEVLRGDLKDEVEELQGAVRRDDR